ncbi:MAG: TSUP family transporter [Lautropia sp.]|nr:TSUP family transporter [Lautropia sp.]
MDYTLVILASLLAGLVDAIVGGGGLVLIPALFATFPDATPATLFGTNKSASIWGTGLSAAQYARRMRLRWQVLAPAIVSAFLGSLAGAWTVTLIDPTFLRRLLPLILLAVLIYTLCRKELGQQAEQRFGPATEAWLMSSIGLLIGFYDGFFGPGTGSFFVFLFVRVLGHDFLQASANAKFLNVATNLSAVGLFAVKGHVWWYMAIAMAIANMVGSLIGTRLALEHGVGFIRRIFMLVVGALILKTGYDALWL